MQKMQEQKQQMQEQRKQVPERSCACACESVTLAQPKESQQLSNEKELGLVQKLVQKP